MSELRERVARAITRAEGIDPDLLCPGVGHRIPVGETWPAWRVRLSEADAAIDEIEKYLLSEPGEKV